MADDDLRLPEGLSDVDRAIVHNVLAENQRLREDLDYQRRQRDEADKRFAEYLPKLSMIQENLSSIAGTLMQMNSKMNSSSTSVYGSLNTPDIEHHVVPLLERITNALEHREDEAWREQFRE